MTRTVLPAPKPSAPDRILGDIPVAKDSIDGRAESRLHDYASFARATPLSRTRPVVEPAALSTAGAAAQISRLPVATVMQRLFVSCKYTSAPTVHAYEPILLRSKTSVAFSVTSAPLKASPVQTRRSHLVSLERRKFASFQFALPPMTPAVIRFAFKAKRMADKSSIEWTDATWNPVTGCTKISAGCDFCYAERFSERFRGTPGHPFEKGFDLTLRPDRLEQPLSWRRPRMIFVNSMSDLFHKEVPKEFIGHVFDTMEKAHWHTFQVLTKRSSLMRNFLRSRYGRSTGPAHIWCGVSVEDGTKLSRVRHLQEAPAGVRFLSVEPLIGPIGKLDLDGIDWVIVGGESGPKARPIEAAWVRSIRDQCKRARVAFFFKQWGGLRPKTRGRELDGREWNDFPKPPASFAVAAE